MISYELSNGAIKVRQPPSGSRTWLRLHRALQFSALFFSRLATVDFDDKMTSLAQDCYEETLARHHSFLVRKVCTGPSKMLLIVYHIAGILSGWLHFLSALRLLPRHKSVR